MTQGGGVVGHATREGWYAQSIIQPSRFESWPPKYLAPQDAAMHNSPERITLCPDQRAG